MANDTVEIKITGDSSDLAAAMKDVADRIELLHDALAGTAGKFEEVGKYAKKAMGDAKKAVEGASQPVEELEKEMGKLAQKFVVVGDKAKEFGQRIMSGPVGKGVTKCC